MNEQCLYQVEVEKNDGKIQGVFFLTRDLGDIQFAVSSDPNIRRITGVNFYGEVSLECFEGAIIDASAYREQCEQTGDYEGLDFSTPFEKPNPDAADAVSLLNHEREKLAKQ